MFESNLKTISKEVFHDKNQVEYFILTHKKHKREMYFRTHDKSALDFAEPKFNSRKKKIIFTLLKLGILQPFLKKINLSKKMGNVIFVGGQIKGFDLKNSYVYSFQYLLPTRSDFIKTKRNQKLLGNQGFAPKVIEIDEVKCFSKEELFSPYTGDASFLFDRLLEFYKMKKIRVLDIEKKVKNYFRKNSVNDPLFNVALDKIKGVDYFLFTRIHG
jgi:hypothetical protein